MKQVEVSLLSWHVKPFSIFILLWGPGLTGLLRGLLLVVLGGNDFIVDTKIWNWIINCGNRVSAPVSATIMAKLVNNPKTIDGIKFDNAKIENPATIVTEVKYMAWPMLL